MKILLLLLLLLFLVGCGESVAPLPHAPQDQIVFVRYVGEAEEIHRVGVDGSGLLNLTVHPSRYRGLQLSPDGRGVVFYSDRGDCYDIWVMDVDGTALTQLTGVEAFERCNFWPRWSPDGSKIAFFSSRDAREGRGWDAYVIGADGTGLTYVGGNPSTDLETSMDVTHAWSPDGRVVIHSTADGSRRTYLVRPDGSGMVRLFPEMDGFLEPYWSPSGQHVAIVRATGGNKDVWVVRPDGSGGVNVSDDPGWDHVPFVAQPWAPHDDVLAFGSSRSGDPDVWVVRADGSGLRNVTSHPGKDVFLSWTPDGRMLISSDREGDADLYLVGPDGSGLSRVLDDPGFGIRSAVWIPGVE